VANRLLKKIIANLAIRVVRSSVMCVGWYATIVNHVSFIIPRNSRAKPGRVGLEVELGETYLFIY
jgi:hypothetical protein